ncbi:MAG TPA: aminotransferase class I/II-fold pyridoxal phosphate-dependent enzyme [Ktedonobacterales bacterium]|nr:aminotransferase class I/II-fold pyridoxal phosphate-dependent enzyme [Ktedonobacterales bacterium]
MTVPETHQRMRVDSDGPLGLNRAVAGAPVSATLRMNEAVAARRAAGQRTIHLGFGEAPFPLPMPLREELARAATRTEYAPVLGLPGLRAAIAAYLARTRGLTASPTTVIVGPGSKAVLYALMRSLAGDVLLPTPSWVSYAPQARLAGKRVYPVATDPADGHRLTHETLDAALRAAREAGGDPRLLVVNTPSNPTGGMFAAADAEQIALWARGEGVTILSDEVYAELAHGWRAHVSPARFYPEGTIVTGGMSKAFSAGGWRLGYAALPATAASEELVAAVRSLAGEIWSSAATPIQQAATVAFAFDDTMERFVLRSARIHAHAAARLHVALVEAGVRCPQPAGAFYLYPDFAPWRDQLAKRGVTTSAELADHLLAEWNIATLPASDFGEAPVALRLRLATSMLYAPASATPANQEAILNRLLEQADDLPADGASGTTQLALPALDEAAAQLAAFVAAQ